MVAEPVDFAPRRNSHGLILASGAVVLVTMVALVVALTPNRGSAPTAISATTLAADVSGAGREQAVVTTNASVEVGAAEVAPLATAEMAPPEVAPLEVAPLAPTDTLPDPLDVVVVVTPTTRQTMTWSRAQQATLPESTTVVSDTGLLIATVVDGTLRLHVD